MPMNTCPFRTALIGSGLTLAATLAQAAAFTNGSFEAAAVDPRAGFITLPVGALSMTGWRVTGGNVDYIGTFWQASDGIRSVDLNGGTRGSIAQTFDTVTGGKYEVLFDMAGNPAGAPSLKQMEVAAGADSALYTFNATGKSFGNMGYEAHSFTFTAIGTITTLSFTSMIPGVYGPVVDNVRVNALSVPEPATYGLLAAGLLGLVARSRNRRA